MDKSHTGFYLINILTTIATTMKSFEAYILVFAYLRYFWNYADIYIPIFSLVVRTKWAFADPLDGSL